MSKISYMNRRAGGMYYVHLRMPPLNGFRPLTRFSLRTSDFRTARRRLLEKLVWLLPIKDAETMEERINAILERLTLYKAQGLPKTDEELDDRLDFENHNHKFVSDLEFAGPRPRNALSLEIAWSQFVTMLQPEPHERPDAEPSEFVLPLLSVPSVGLAQLAIPISFLRQPIESHGIVAGDEAHGQPNNDVASAISQPVSAPVAPPPAPPSGGMVRKTMSQALKEFLTYREMIDGDRRAESDVAPIVRFAIALLGDPIMLDFSGDDALLLKIEMAEIPTNFGFSRDEASDLHTKYKIAKQCGFRRKVNGSEIVLRRASKNTLANRYKSGLRAFFTWLTDHKIAHGPVPNFSFVPKRNPRKVERDAFRPEELLKLFSMPLFTGCEGRARIWQKGEYFFQNFFYWCVLISLLCGMRPGEIVQLRCRDILDLYDQPHFRFAQFPDSDDDADQAGGNQAKTPNAFRWVPIHQLLVRLGIIERRDALVRAYIENEKARRGATMIPEGEMATVLRAAHDQWLFPDWGVYVKTTGEIKWSQAATKAWGHLKRTYGFERKGVTLYSARHSFKGRIDDLKGLSERSRKVLGGWSTTDSVPNQYGPKRITEEQMTILLGINDSTIDEIADILTTARIKAQMRELKTIDAWKIDMRSDDEAFQVALAKRGTLYY